MTAEDYHLLDADFLHCHYEACSLSATCARYAASTLLRERRQDRYEVVNHYAIAQLSTCPYFLADEKLRYAWGISRIFDELKHSDVQTAKYRVVTYLGQATYYHVKRHLRVLTPENQSQIRDIITSLGYDGSRIEFDRYEEAYPYLMKLSHRKRR